MCKEKTLKQEYAKTCTPWGEDELTADETAHTSDGMSVRELSDGTGVFPSLISARDACAATKDGQCKGVLDPTCDDPTHGGFRLCKEMTPDEGDDALHSCVFVFTAHAPTIYGYAAPDQDHFVTADAGLARVATNEIVGYKVSFERGAVAEQPKLTLFDPAVLQRDMGNCKECVVQIHLHVRRQVCSVRAMYEDWSNFAYGTRSHKKVKTQGNGLDSQLAMQCHETSPSDETRYQYVQKTVKNGKDFKEPWLAMEYPPEGSSASSMSRSGDEIDKLRVYGDSVTCGDELEECSAIAEGCATCLMAADSADRKKRFGWLPSVGSRNNKKKTYNHCRYCPAQRKCMSENQKCASKSVEFPASRTKVTKTAAQAKADATCTADGTAKALSKKADGCWHAYTPAYKKGGTKHNGCSGWKEHGYKCSEDDKWCAMMDPGGSPSTCAEQGPADSIVNTVTGMCMTAAHTRAVARSVQLLPTSPSAAYPTPRLRRATLSPPPPASRRNNVMPHCCCRCQSSVSRRPAGPPVPGSERAASVM